MTRSLFVASILLAIAGCTLGGDLSSSPVVPSVVSPTSTITATPTPTQQWLRCSTDIVFQASALSGPLEPSAAQDEAAVIFRRFPAPPDIWRRLIDNDKRVVFAAANPSDWEGNSGGGDSGGAGNLRFVDVANIDGAWRVAANGDCWPRVVLEGGLQYSSWALATVSDDGRQLVLLVTEFECTSGQPPGERVRPPVIVETDHDVTIAFGIEPIGGIQDCPTAPATPYRVTLGAPLGQRVLQDGIYVPPRVVEIP